MLLEHTEWMNPVSLAWMGSLRPGYHKGGLQVLVNYVDLIRES